MDGAIVKHAIAFIATYYGLDRTNITAQVNAMKQEGWQVTVWIGSSMYQRVVVTEDGTVQWHAADSGALD